MCDLSKYIEFIILPLLILPICISTQENGIIGAPTCDLDKTGNQNPAISQLNKSLGTMDAPPNQVVRP
jgi:hypothetical protein